MTDNVSNADTRAGADDVTIEADPPIDRRAIPSAAHETVFRLPDGHDIRRIDWSGAGNVVAEPRGSILFLPGRGDNYEKYLETLEQWHRAGWRVTAADWRGQAGSGRLGDDAVTGHIADYSVWIDDLKALWADWKASTPGPHILSGHSMGGHLVVRALVERKVDPDAVVLSAPMLGYFGMVLPLRFMHGAAKIIKRFKGGTHPAWKWSEKPGELPIGRINLLTHDEDRYADELWWREKRPELVMGPGSWNWVERGYASMRVLDTAGSLEGVETPVLLVATSADKLVDIEAIRIAADRLPNGELVEFGNESAHEILREVDAVRDRAMDAIASFLDRVAPA